MDEYSWAITSLGVGGAIIAGGLGIPRLRQWYENWQLQREDEILDSQAQNLDGIIANFMTDYQGNIDIKLVKNVPVTKAEDKIIVPEVIRYKEAPSVGKYIHCIVPEPLKHNHPDIKSHNSKRYDGLDRILSNGQYIEMRAIKESETHYRVRDVLNVVHTRLVEEWRR